MKSLKSFNRRGIAIAGSAVTALALTAAPARADQDKTAPQIPVCTHRIGSLVIDEPSRDWWSAYHLGAPEILLKAVIMRSGCFTVAARGRQMDELEREREIAGVAPNAGMRAADYILQPDLTPQSHGSGVNLGGLFGRFVGGTAGSLLSNLTISTKQADVSLTLTDVRSGDQVDFEQGHAEKTNLNLGGGYGPWSRLGALGAMGYSNTPTGQVIAAAYIQAFTKLVTRMGGAPATPAPAVEAQTAASSAPAANDDSQTASTPAATNASNTANSAVVMARPGRMYKKPKPSAHLIRALTRGEMLYPTGKKHGVWWKVEDESGDTGWVSSLAFSPAG